MVNQNQAIGYLPDERPPVWKLLLYALQQVVGPCSRRRSPWASDGFHVSPRSSPAPCHELLILITDADSPLQWFQFSNLSRFWR
jgi:uracil permease